MDDHVTPRRVVIVGGGFAGLFAARLLGSVPVAVTLVDRCAHHLFQPLLYQCATGILSEGEIARPLRTVLRRHKNVRCVLAEVTDIDARRRVVHADRAKGGSLALEYDDLIVATGVRQSYFGHDGFARHAPGLKTLGDALEIRRRLYRAFEAAEAADDPREQQRHLSFALVGGGPTGVELAGQIREIATHTIEREFARIDARQARVLLFEGGEAVLAGFGPTLSRRAARALEHLGVEVHLGTLVEDVDEEGLQVRTKEGGSTRHEAGTVLWTAGVQAPPLVARLAEATGARQDRSGRIVVEPDLTIPGHPEIRVVGDTMAVEGVPGVAEAAMQAGIYAALRIRHEVEGRTGRPRPFRYRDLGNAAYIARGQAVVRRGRMEMSGMLGWLMWLVVHITFLTGFRSRLGALASWAFAFASGARRERAFVARGTTPG